MPGIAAAACVYHRVIWLLSAATVVVYTNMFLVVLFMWFGSSSSVLFDVFSVLLEAEGLFHCILL